MDVLDRVLVVLPAEGRMEINPMKSKPRAAEIRMDEAPADNS